jgi:chorismate mutase
MAKNIDIEALRNALREIDDELMNIVCRRVEVVRKIGSMKAVHGLSIQDHQQEALNKTTNRQLVGDRAPSEFIDELTDLLARWSRQIQAKQP